MLPPCVPPDVPRPKAEPRWWDTVGSVSLEFILKEIIHHTIHSSTHFWLIHITRE